MTSIKFSGTFTFNNLDKPVQRLAVQTMAEEMDKYLPTAEFNHYQVSRIDWQPNEDTLDIQVYNRAKILGRHYLETLPDLDKRLKAKLDGSGIPYTYSPKLGYANQNVDKKNWLQKALGLGKQAKIAETRVASSPD